MAEYYRNAWYAQLQKKVAELEEEIREAIELPEVTAEDEGKILAVSNSGDWVVEQPLNHHNYSTTEQVVGKWIDDRDVYEIVIEFNNTIIFTNSSWVTLISNWRTDIDIITKATVIEVGQNDTTCLSVDVKSNKVSGDLQIIGLSGSKGMNTVILQYVKVPTPYSVNRRKGTVCQHQFQIKQQKVL